ncbi:MAG: hypothetical protein AB8B63_06605 [Granulosicoccus sp.]
MVVNIAGVLVVSYLGFVFFSEHVNPLRKPAVFVNRRRWRYGRRMGLATFGAGLIFFFLVEYFAVHPAFALSAALFEFSLLWWLFSSRLSSQSHW